MNVDPKRMKAARLAMMYGASDVKTGIVLGEYPSPNVLAMDVPLVAAYPGLRRAALAMDADHGLSVGARDVSEWLRILDKVVLSPNTCPSDLKAWSDWLNGLSAEDFESAVNGEDEEMGRALESAPEPTGSAYTLHGLLDEMFMELCNG